MALASPPTAAAELRRTLERMKSHAGGERKVLPFGMPEIDDRLSGGLVLSHCTK